jgi:hypothetical protein
MELKNILTIIFKRALSFLIFIILLFCMRFLIPLANNGFFTAIVSFLEGSVWILFLSTLFLMLGELFDELLFPLNLPAPILLAASSLFVLSFIFGLLSLIFQLTGSRFLLDVQPFYSLIYLIVFLLVLIAGYLDILNKMPKGGFYHRSHGGEDSPVTPKKRPARRRR